MFLTPTSPPEVSDTQTASLRAVVRGRVQGVGFRAFVVAEARELGLSGGVRNLSDGNTVEVNAAGGRAALATLLGRLRAGPPGSRVIEVEERWGEGEAATAEPRFRVL